MDDVAKLEAELSALWDRYNGGGVQAEMENLREQILQTDVAVARARVSKIQTAKRGLSR